jgi:hypothetical protein
VFFGTILLCVGENVNIVNLSFGAPPKKFSMI